MNDPGDPGNPLQGLLGDLLKMIGSAPGSATAWLEAARALAQGVATEGEPEANPDPIERIRLEELVRVAEMHVADATGLPVGPPARPLGVLPVGRGAWALLALESWTPLVEKMVDAQATATPEVPAVPDGLTTEDGGLGELLGRFATTMGPVLLGMQFGSAAGHLARRALGRYALPLPWTDHGDLLVVPANIAAFAEDWSLPVDQAQLWVCIRELTAEAVLGTPHVAERLRTLLESAATDAVSAQLGLAERLGGEAGDPMALQGLLADPEALLADMLTPGQRRTATQLVAITTALGGYVDHVTAQVAVTLVGSSGALSEAWYRYRIADATGEQAAGALFGLDLGREQVDRGAAFVRGVVERAGEGGLARLWASDRTLPTPAEVDAPGLWLERIDLPDEGSDGG
jgi:putative hydrolase